MIGGLSIRLSVESDMEHWKRWAAAADVSRWFPFTSEDEIDIAARHVFSFLPQQAVLTAEDDGQPCGIAGLELPGFRKTMHQASLWILVAESHRNLGVGSMLLQALLARGRDCHGLRLVLIEVFEGNPLVASIRRWDLSILVINLAIAKWRINFWGVTYVQSSLGFTLSFHRP